MANSYKEFIAPDTATIVEQLDDLLVKFVGWYRIDTIADTSTDKDYVWSSDGEDPDNSNPVTIRIASNSSNDLLFYTYETYTNSSTNTGEIHDVNASEFGGLSANVKCRLIASKDRVVIVCDEGLNNFYTAYLGKLVSFYEFPDDPYPHVVKGQSSNTDNWYDISDDQFFAIDSGGNVREYFSFGYSTIVSNGDPNPRNNQLSFAAPLLYRDEGDAFDELRGRFIGTYRVSPDAVGHGTYVSFGNDVYIAIKTSDQSQANVFGPISADGTVPPDLPVFSYSNRGMENDGDTLALYRFDSDSGGIFTDETGNYTATISGTSLVDSPLQKAATFGGDDVGLGTGDSTAEAAMKGEWTFEAVYRPTNDIQLDDTQVLCAYTQSGTGSANNALARVLVSGTNSLGVNWETGTQQKTLNATPSGVVNTTFWNYSAWVKKDNGSNYDVEIWHGSFGDSKPNLITTISGLPNATGGGDSIFILGSDENYSPQLITTASLTNHSFEDNSTNGWTIVAGSWATYTNDGDISSAKDGSYFLSGQGTSDCEIYQEVSLPGSVQPGDTVKAFVWQANSFTEDQGKVELSARDGGGSISTVGTDYEEILPLGTWELKELSLIVPEGTTTIRISLFAKYVTGSHPNACFDDVSIEFYSSSAGFIGDIDELRVSSKARSQQELETSFSRVKL